MKLLGCVIRVRITLRDYQIIFQSSGMILHSHRQYENSSCFTFLPTFFMCLSSAYLSSLVKWFFKFFADFFKLAFYFAVVEF